MRIGVGIGFIGLLISMFIVLYLWSPHTAQVSQTYTTMKPQVEKLAGRDETGMKNQDSIKLEAQQSSGRLKGILVTSIVAGGPMQKHMGLQADDLIVEVGMGGSLTKVGDITGGAEMVIALIWQAPQQNQPLVVERAGQRITLPQTPGTVTPAPTNTPPPKKNTLQDQLDAISKPR